jgi:hypothetical protein
MLRLNAYQKLKIAKINLEAKERWVRTSIRRVIGFYNQQADFEEPETKRKVDTIVEKVEKVLYSTDAPLKEVIDSIPFSTYFLDGNPDFRLPCRREQNGCIMRAMKERVEVLQ